MPWLVTALTFFVSAAPAQADGLALQTYEDQQMRVDLPRGWTIQRVNGGRTLIAIESTQGSKAVITIDRLPPGSDIDSSAAQSLIAKNKPRGYRRIGTAVDGKVMILLGNEPPGRVAAYVAKARDVAVGNVLVMFLGPGERFDRYDGVDLVQNVAHSVGHPGRRGSAAA
ncbi:MAG: hypothetical protein AAF772_17435, partial [Acidobacteriota bacterium]